MVENSGLALRQAEENAARHAAAVVNADSKEFANRAKRARMTKSKPDPAARTTF